MQLLRLFLTVTLLSFGFSTLPMEYNQQDDKQEKEEQKSPNSGKTNSVSDQVPSLVDLCLEAVSNKILFPICRQTTAENLENTNQQINTNLTKLPNELQEPLKNTFTAQFDNQELEIDEQRKNSTLPIVTSWNIQTNTSFQAVKDDNTIHIFDADTEQTSTITPDSSITTFCLVPTKPVLGCILDDGRIQLWDLKTSSCIKTIQANLVDNLPLVHLIVSPTLEYLAASNREHQAIYIWDIKTGKELNHAITNMPGTDMHLEQFTPTNALIVQFQPDRGGDDSKYYQLWNLQEDHGLTLPKVSFALLKEIEYSPKGGYIACKYHRSNDAIAILDTTTGTFKNFNFKHITQDSHYKYNTKDGLFWFDWVNSFKFSADGKHLVVASDQHLFIIDIMSNTIKEIQMPVINLVKNSPNAEYDHNKIINLNKRYFITIGNLQSRKFGYNNPGYAHHRIFVWDITTGSCIKIMPMKLLDNIIHCLSEKNKIIMYGTQSNNLQPYLETFTFNFTSHNDALTILPLEYALIDAESKDDDESRVKTQQLREQIEAMYKPKSESNKSDKSEE